MPAWGWIVLCIGAFCFGWTLGADWLRNRGPFLKFRLAGERIKPYRDDYFVCAERGDDETGDGSKEKPFKTLARLKKEFEK